MTCQIRFSSMSQTVISFVSCSMYNILFHKMAADISYILFHAREVGSSAKTTSANSDNSKAKNFSQEVDGFKVHL